MLITELFEARSNPTQNKDNRASDVSEYLRGLDYETGELFMSFTQIDKVGMNPQSTYNTPLGVYCYPINRHTIEDYDNNSLPFAGDAKFVNIIKSRGSQLNVQDYGDDDLADDSKRLTRYLLKIFPENENEIDQIHALAVQDAKNGTHGKKTAASYIWNYTRWAAYLLDIKDPKAIIRKMSGFDSTTPSKTAATWNAVLRKVLGYDSVVDNGWGIIHENEPTQAVFLDVRGFQLVSRRVNTNWSGRLLKKINLSTVPWLWKNNNIAFRSILAALEIFITKAPVVLNRKYEVNRDKLRQEVPGYFAALRSVIRYTHVTMQEASYIAHGIMSHIRNGGILEHLNQDERLELLEWWLPFFQKGFSTQTDLASNETFKRDYMNVFVHVLDDAHYAKFEEFVANYG